MKEQHLWQLLEGYATARADFPDLLRPRPV